MHGCFVSCCAPALPGYIVRWLTGLRALIATDRNASAPTCSKSSACSSSDSLTARGAPPSPASCPSPHLSPLNKHTYVRRRKRDLFLRLGACVQITDIALFAKQNASASKDRPLCWTCRRACLSFVCCYPGIINTLRSNPHWLGKCQYETATTLTRDALALVSDAFVLTLQPLRSKHLTLVSCADGPCSNICALAVARAEGPSL